MASEEVPPVNIVGNASNTEYEEEEAEQEEGQAAEEEEGQARPPQGSWEGSYIKQADIDRLRRSRRIPEGVLTRVPPKG